MIVFSSPVPSEQQTSSGANGVVDLFWTKKGKRVFGSLTTLIIKGLNSTKALTDIFESREPVDNLSLKNTTWYSILHENHELRVDSVSSKDCYQYVGIWKGPPWLPPPPSRRRAGARARHGMTQHGRWLFPPTGFTGFLSVVHPYVEGLLWRLSQGSMQHPS